MAAEEMATFESKLAAWLVENGPSFSTILPSSVANAAAKLVPPQAELARLAFWATFSARAWWGTGRAPLLARQPPDWRSRVSKAGLGLFFRGPF